MVSRRRVLAAGCLALAGGSGCSRIRDAIAADTTSEGTETGADTDGTATSDGTTGTTPDASEFRITVTADDREVELATGADVASVGEVEPARGGDGYRLPMTLGDEGTASFADGLERVGALEDPQSHRIRTYFEGELLYEAKLGPRLADAIKSGEWDGSFLFHVSDRGTAEQVRDALKTDETTAER